MLGRRRRSLPPLKRTTTTSFVVRARLPGVTTRSPVQREAHRLRRSPACPRVAAKVAENAAGATLVVARSGNPPALVGLETRRTFPQVLIGCWEQGDHKGRPYILLALPHLSVAA